MRELVSNGSRLEEAHPHLTGLALASCVVLSMVTQAFAQASSAAHTQVVQLVDERAANWKQVSKQIWDYPELGYHEEKSSALLQAQLKAAGFSVEAGVADEPTAFIASYGKGKPVIAILATGDEIALPGEPIPPGGIVSSNSHALAALITAAGGEPMVLPVAPDDRNAIAAATDAAAKADMLVTTGGASVGEHDLVQDALRDRGLTLDFWKIAMRPGKPLMFGALGSIPLLGLPGNPVSSLITSILFLVPAIWRLSGLSCESLPVTPAVLGTPLKANDHRADYLRAGLTTIADGSVVVTAFDRQDSGMLRLLTQSDALILRPPHAPALDAGACVPIIRLGTIGL